MMVRRVYGWSDSDDGEKKKVEGFWVERDWRRITRKITGFEEDEGGFDEF
ncbi:hypothetical protein L195_g055290 [Trifolium pratense]|uniref:Uncharacterized protein n=1 Tax=Trifolium pratense TaxID=57577 RepID=A0A2K3KKJ7_TRIPR|nr:hypothetical protein L195_g055290 [Trifolium pratense]